MLMHSTHVAGPRMLRALGLPTEGCVGLTIDFKPNSFVTAHAEYAVTQEGLQALQDLIPMMVVEVKGRKISAPEATQGHPGMETKG